MTFASTPMSLTSQTGVHQMAEKYASTHASTHKEADDAAEPAKGTAKAAAKAGTSITIDEPTDGAAVNTPFAVTGTCHGGTHVTVAAMYAGNPAVTVKADVKQNKWKAELTPPGGAGYTVKASVDGANPPVEESRNVSVK